MKTTVITQPIAPRYELWKFTLHLTPGISEWEAIETFIRITDEIEEIARKPVSIDAKTGRVCSEHDLTRQLKVLVCQLEKGKKQGNYHIQGYFRLTWYCWYAGLEYLFTMFDKKKTFYSGASINEIEHCEEYCTKEDTRVRGTEPIKILLQNN